MLRRIGWGFNRDGRVIWRVWGLIIGEGWINREVRVIGWKCLRGIGSNFFFCVINGIVWSESSDLGM